MSRQPRRHFTAEFKEQAVAQLSEPGATQTSIARELGVPPSQPIDTRIETIELMAHHSENAVCDLGHFQLIFSPMLSGKLRHG
ncbi:transposase, partial [Rhodovulum sulfidophilum]|uniref:transposase n=1 Tax=Rhodovulum sulfidophilum TaxID=35806 RepID=UPI001924A0A9